MKIAKVCKNKLLLIVSLLVFVEFCNGQISPKWTFHDELIENLEFPRDTIYIQDRKKLEKLDGLGTSHNNAVIHYTSKAGGNVSILIASSPFNNFKHKVNYDTVFNSDDKEKYYCQIQNINGRKAYGIDGDIPKNEIEEFKIEWNNHWLKIPKRAYSDLFEPHPDIEAYLSKNNTLLFIYLYGSDGAGSYAVKFIFNKSGYLTRLITTNECVNGFDFLDATAPPCD
jgi:hypothetical protein